MSATSMSPALKLVLKVVMNIALIWGLDSFLPHYFSLFGGLPAFIIVGSLLTLMNMFLRPLLAIITFPFHLLFTLLTTIVVNAFFLFVIYEITLKMDPTVVTLTMAGGIVGWLVVSLILGFANWFIKHVL